MKKVLALLLVLCLLPVVGLATDFTGIYPISDEKIELRVFCRADPAATDYDTNKEVVWAEELTNVHVNWELASTTDLDIKYNLSVSSGDYPDIYLYYSQPSDLLQEAEDGVIIPLNDLIENETVFIKAYLEEHPEVREMITAPDGNIYALFSTLYNLPESQYNRCWVLKSWLEAYTAATGNGMPTTTDEFRAMLEYFRDNDMNGNGDPSDEIPLTGNYARWMEGSDPTFYLLNAFCVVPADLAVNNAFFYADENGKLYTDITSDAFREGLKYVNGLYKDGLLAEETFVQDLNQFRATTSVPRNQQKVGTAGAPYPLRLVTLNENPDYTSYADYVVIPPLTGPDGHKGVPTNYMDVVYLRGTITTACKDPVAAIKWLDLWISEEGSMWTDRYGFEGDTWEWIDEPSIGGDDKAVQINFASTGTQNQYLCRGSNVLYITPETMTSTISESSAPRNSSGWMYLQAEEYKNAAIPENIPKIIWCADSDLYVEKTDLDTLFRDYITNITTEFVVGAKDINDDATWNAYLAELNNMGLEHYMKVLETYYFAK